MRGIVNSELRLQVGIESERISLKLADAVIPETTRARLQVKHARLDPFALKKSPELKLKKFFTALGNLNRESTKT
jgi:hypothetical protein